MATENDSDEMAMITALESRKLEIVMGPGDRAGLEEKYGQVWNTEELQKEFEVVEFLAPYVLVKRRSDSEMGTVEFLPRPRFYFNFTRLTEEEKSCVR